MPRLDGRSGKLTFPPASFYFPPPIFHNPCPDNYYYHDDITTMAVACETLSECQYLFIDPTKYFTIYYFCNQTMTKKNLPKCLFATWNTDCSPLLFNKVCYLRFIDLANLEFILHIYKISLLSASWS